ncbi:hypothetical protein OCS_06488 [Ophiocordyceps sinensis CO18]|uniref:Uncharacterized protein n=1 Tax=Ophiocordyceps sinensis (strain Co18 / CGMCC 3.14243) TaxID=911162 RepID=T5A5D6_OPHSC|nr:hypothetical protein OCS_06488 [Ophiocordyceps sinensis CO18]
MIDTALDFYAVPRDELQKHIGDAEASGRGADGVSVSQALKHFVRDWTDEGNHERAAPFACLQRTLDMLFPERHAAADKVKILLPGAGLGFQVTINEWSMFMNVAYRYVQRHGLKDGLTFHPFVDGWSHHASDSKMQRQLPFPDVDKGVKRQSVFESMALDISICHVHKHGPLVDGTIKMVLKPGGYWINLGPLLYGTAPFVQLSLQDIVKVAEAIEFEFMETSDECGTPTFANSTVRSIEAIYGFDKEALTKNSYNAQFWVAKKS